MTRRGKSGVEVPSHRLTLEQAGKGGGVGADEALKGFGREENKRWTVSCKRVGSKRGWF